MEGQQPKETNERIVGKGGLLNVFSNVPVYHPELRATYNDIKEHLIVSKEPYRLNGRALSACLETVGKGRAPVSFSLNDVSRIEIELNRQINNFPEHWVIGEKDLKKVLSISGHNKGRDFKKVYDSLENHLFETSGKPYKLDGRLLNARLGDAEAMSLIVGLSPAAVNAIAKHLDIPEIPLEQFVPEKQEELPTILPEDIDPRLLEVANRLRTFLDDGGGCLRPWQKYRLEEVYEKALIRGDNRHYIKAPTGSGKTVTFGEEIRVIDMPTLIVVPTRNLVNQIVTELTDTKTVGMDSKKVGGYHSSLPKEDREAALDKQYLVTTYASLRNLVKKGVLSPKDRPIVMLDEVHRSLGHRTRIALGPFMEEALLIQGWTATTVFRDGRNVGNELFEGKKPVSTSSLLDGIARDELVTPRFFTVHTDVDLSSVGIQGGDFTQEALHKVMEEKGVDRDLAAAKFLQYITNPKNEHEFSGVPIAVYAAGTKHADRLHNIFKKVMPDRTIETIHSNLKGEQQKNPKQIKDILERQRRGEVQIMINCDMLTEGWDSPQTGIILMLRPSLSPVLMEQILGRVLRLFEGKDSAFLINFHDKNSSSLSFEGLLEPSKGSMPDLEALQELLELPQRNVLEEDAGEQKVKASVKHVPRKPAQFERILTEFMAQDGALKNLRATWTLEEQKQFLASLQKERKKYEPFPDNFIIGKLSIAKEVYLAVDNEKLTVLYSQIKESLGQGTPFTLNNQVLDARIGKSGTVTSIGFSPNDMESIKTELKFVEKHSEDWLTGKDRLSNTLGVSLQNTKFVTLYGQIEASLDKGKPFVLDGTTLDARIGRRGRNKGIGFSPNDIESLKIKFATSKQHNENWFSGRQSLFKAMHDKSCDAKCEDLYNRVEASLGKGKPFVLDGTTLDARIGRNYRITTVGFSPDDIEKIRKKFGLVDQHPEGWTSGQTNLLNAVDIGSDNIEVKSLYHKIESSLDQGKLFTLGDRVLDARMGKRGPKISIGFSPDDITSIKKELGVVEKHPEDWLAGQTRVSKAMHDDIHNKEWKNLYHKIESSLDQGKLFTLGDRVLDARMGKRGSRISIGFSPDDITSIKKELGLVEKHPEDWLTGKIGLSRATGNNKTNPSVMSLYRKIEASLKQGKPFTFGDIELDARMGRSGNITTVGFSPHDIAPLKEELERLKIELKHSKATTESQTVLHPKTKGLISQNLKKPAPTKKDLTPSKDNPHLRRTDRGRGKSKGDEDG